MRRITRTVALILSSALFLAAGCARAPKAQTVPGGKLSSPPPSRAEVRETEAVPKPQPRTIIPDEERKAAADAAALEAKSLTDSGDAPAAILEEALAAYQKAKEARGRDDLDGAVSALDEAFALLLKLRIPPDSPYEKEKDDLRLLIAQRIQEIHASRLKPVADNQKCIPLIENKWVQREIDSFRGPERKFFEEAYRRSGLYRAWIEEQLRAAGLPETLAWLPLIESWFMPRAQSYARALGPWQFIPSTGAFYGLNRDRFIDERMDPYKATRAAIRYLTDLHAMFGEWTTALAAYNCGEGYVQSVVNSQHVDYLDDFWDLFTRLPYQTARYVPRFIATVLIVQNPEKYGFDLPEPYAALAFETLPVSRPAKLAALSAAMGLDATVLPYLNPELRYESTPDREYSLRVPVGSTDKAAAAIAGLPAFVPPAAPSLAWHVVQGGETLTKIAARYGTSIQVLQQLNGMRDASLHAGQRLKVPVRG